jgi:hypothetical protein
MKDWARFYNVYKLVSRFLICIGTNTQHYKNEIRSNIVLALL